MEDRNNINMEIRELQSDLISLRQSFINMANLRYKRKTEEKLKSLDKYEYQEEKIDLPTFSFDVDELSPTEAIKLRKMLKKCIKLFQILSYKIDCPISEIIDKI